MEPTAKNPDPHHIFIDEVQGHQRRWLKVTNLRVVHEGGGHHAGGGYCGPRYRELAVLRAL